MGGVNRLSASFESRGHCRRMANHAVMMSELKIRKSYHWISAVLPAAINGDNRRHFRSEVILYRHIYWLEIIAWAVWRNQKLHSKARSFLSFHLNQIRGGFFYFLRRLEPFFCRITHSSGVIREWTEINRCRKPGLSRRIPAAKAAIPPGGDFCTKCLVWNRKCCCPGGKKRVR